MRSKNEIFKEIKKIVDSPGYIYALLMIILDDFYVDPENLHKLNSWKQLNMNEAALLIGLLIQKPIDFTQPDSWSNLFKLKYDTRKLLKELHQSFHKVFLKKCKKI